MGLITRLLIFRDFIVMEEWLDAKAESVKKSSIEVHDWDKPVEEQHFCAKVEIDDPALATYFKLTWC